MFGCRICRGSDVGCRIYKGSNAPVYSITSIPPGSRVRMAAQKPDQDGSFVREVQGRPGGTGHLFPGHWPSTWPLLATYFLLHYSVPD